MADKKKKKKKNVDKNANVKNKSALARSIESSKKQRTAALKAKPKSPAQQQQQKEKQRRSGLREYFRGVRTEIKKVVWPTRKELFSYTVIVLVACAFFGLFLWAVDTGFLAVIREVFGIGDMNLGDLNISDLIVE